MSVPLAPVYSTDDPMTGHVQPLGLFGIIAGESEFAELRGSLEAHRGEIADAERSAIAAYLRGGAIVFALMEWTSDRATSSEVECALEDVLTDGRYYWRRDSAEYVERYGIGLPDEFLVLGRGLGWSAPKVERDQLRLIDAFLLKHGRRAVQVGG